MSASANTPEREITVFFCTHQGERVARIFQGTERAGHDEGPQVCPSPVRGSWKFFNSPGPWRTAPTGWRFSGARRASAGTCSGAPGERAESPMPGRILEEIGLEKERVRRFVLPADPGPESMKELSDWVEKIRGLESIPAR